MLEEAGYRVIEAADGHEALDLYGRHRKTVRLIVSDLIMPKLGGRDLYGALSRQYGEVPFLLATGYADRFDQESGDAFELPVPLLLKPWTITELTARVRELLDRWEQAGDRGA